MQEGELAKLPLLKFVSALLRSTNSKGRLTTLGRPGLALSTRASPLISTRLTYQTVTQVAPARVKDQEPAPRIVLQFVQRMRKCPPRLVERRAIYTSTQYLPDPILSPSLLSHALITVRLLANKIDSSTHRYIHLQPVCHVHRKDAQLFQRK